MGTNRDRTMGFDVELMDLMILEARCDDRCGEESTLAFVHAFLYKRKIRHSKLKRTHNGTSADGQKVINTRKSDLEVAQISVIHTFCQQLRDQKDREQSLHSNRNRFSVQEIDFCRE